MTAWKTVIVGAFVAFMCGGVVARIAAGAPERPLSVEIDGAGPAGRQVEGAVRPAQFHLRCAGACDDVRLTFRGTPDRVLAARITDPSGRVEVTTRDAVGGVARLAAGGQ